MLPDYPILAAGDDGYGKIIGLVILVVIIVVAKILELFVKKFKQEEVSEEVSEEDTAPPPPPPVRRPQPPARLERSRYEPPPQRTPMPPRVQQPAIHRGAGRTVVGPSGGVQATQRGHFETPPQRVRPQRPVALDEPVLVEEEQSVRVGEELGREQLRRQQEDARRQKRMSTLAPAEADTAAIEQRIVSIRPGMAAATVAGTEQTVVDLRNRQFARQAIILHEILSPPKGIRQEKEMWDL